MRESRSTAQRGSAAIELPLAIGLLLLPVALLVITIPAWPERQTVARAAAAEASRAVVLAGSWPEGADEARAVVAQTAANHGLEPGALSLQLTGSLERGASVTARVTVEMPALALPGLAAVSRWAWSTSHTEHVDDFRGFP